MSDVHFDSIKCDVALFEQHLAMAESLNAPVLIAGDLFDAMQGHDDPRRSLEELKHEYKHDNYLDLLVLDVAKTLLKYKVTYIIGMGNHESKVQEKMNTNLTERLCYAVNTGGGHSYSMGYWGFIRFSFKYKKGTSVWKKIMYWHHGLGGNSPVTKGVIDSNRQAVYLPEADIVVNGHNHQQYTLPIPRYKLANNGVPYQENQWHVRTPSYKMSGLLAGDRTGFDVEKHPAPAPRGCVRIDWHFEKNDGVRITPIALLL